METDYTRATFETPVYPRRPRDQYTAPNSKHIECIPPNRIEGSPPPPTKENKQTNKNETAIRDCILTKISQNEDQPVDEIDESISDNVEVQTE